MQAMVAEASRNIRPILSGAATHPACRNLAGRGGAPFFVSLRRYEKERNGVPDSVDDQPLRPFSIFCRAVPRCAGCRSGAAMSPCSTGVTPVGDDATRRHAGRHPRKRLIPALEFCCSKSGVGSRHRLLHGARHCLRRARRLRRNLCAPSLWRVRGIFMQGTRCGVAHTIGARHRRYRWSRKRQPACWIQSVFAVINGQRTVRKFTEFSAMDQNREDARMFVTQWRTG